MKTTLCSAVLTLALLPAGLRAQEKDEARERVERRIRMFRILELSERLDLDETQALRLNEQLETIEKKRKTVRDEERELQKTIRRAARGDADAQKDVDRAVGKLLDNRKKMIDIDREAYETLGKSLSAQQRARLAIFAHEFPRQVERMAREARERDRHTKRDEPATPPAP